MALEGVDLVLFLPSLGDERKGELLGVVKDDPATADLPALSLSTDMKAQLDEQSDSVCLAVVHGGSRAGDRAGRASAWRRRGPRR